MNLTCGGVSDTVSEKRQEGNKGFSVSIEACEDFYVVCLVGRAAYTNFYISL